jgi:hypothetical protein
LAAAKGKDGNPLTNGVNGHDDDAEDEKRWIERAGWKPRFGNGSTHDSIEGESMLDHQTWVEGKLEDKFYGGKSSSTQQLTRNNN